MGDFPVHIYVSINQTLFIFLRLRNKYIQLIFIITCINHLYLVGTDICICVVCMWEETQVSRGYPPARLGDQSGNDKVICFILIDPRGNVMRTESPEGVLIVSANGRIWHSRKFVGKEVVTLGQYLLSYGILP